MVQKPGCRSVQQLRSGRTVNVMPSSPPELCMGVGELFHMLSEIPFFTACLLFVQTSVTVFVDFADSDFRLIKVGF
ncbi:hypothetical protein V5J36_004873 [Endozoicomonas sp. NE41]